MPIETAPNTLSQIVGPAHDTAETAHSGFIPAEILHLDPDIQGGSVDGSQLPKGRHSSGSAPDKSQTPIYAQLKEERGVPSGKHRADTPTDEPPARNVAFSRRTITDKDGNTVTGVFSNGDNPSEMADSVYTTTFQVSREGSKPTQEALRSSRQEMAQNTETNRVGQELVVQKAGSIAVRQAVSSSTELVSSPVAEVKSSREQAVTPSTELVLPSSEAAGEQAVTTLPETEISPRSLQEDISYLVDKLRQGSPNNLSAEDKALLSRVSSLIHLEKMPSTGTLQEKGFFGYEGDGRNGSVSRSPLNYEEAVRIKGAVATLQMKGGERPTPSNAVAAEAQSIKVNQPPAAGHAGQTEAAPADSPEQSDGSESSRWDRFKAFFGRKAWTAAKNGRSQQGQDPSVATEGQSTEVATREPSEAERWRAEWESLRASDPEGAQDFAVSTVQSDPIGTLEKMDSRDPVLREQAGALWSLFALAKPDDATQLREKYAQSRMAQEYARQQAAGLV